MTWRRQADWLSLSVVLVAIAALQGTTWHWWGLWAAGAVILAWPTSARTSGGSSTPSGN